jgi:hypothetical protein
MQNMVVIVELLYGTWERRENDRAPHNICEGRCHNDMYAHLLKKVGLGRKV